MRLLDVSAVLKRERDIRPAGSKPEVLKQPDDETERYAEVLEQFDDETEKYAIVSHRWGIRTEEVDYDEITGLVKMNEKDRDKVRDRDGYRKIIKSCEKAEEDGHRWLWIDTCCVDKRNSVELSEAICSMYRWYRNSQTCYVYLNDVDESAFPTEQDFGKFRTSNGWPEWFSRGWTLQELIAPTELEFFNKSWTSIGTKQDLTSTLEGITRIPVKVLGGGQVLRSRSPCNVAQAMSWAADRKTTRVEDRAYSLMGLFGVNMPMMYGEGSKAFQRLQLEILRVDSDHTILAWNPKGTWSPGSVLADDPSCFRDCHDIQNVGPDEFVHKVGVYMRKNMPGKVIDWVKLLRLRRRLRSLQLSRWDVTSLGIQVTLPVLPDRDDPELFRVMLPCCDGYGNLITIDIFSLPGDHRSYRWSYSTWLTVGSVPVLKSLYVAYVQHTVESRHDLRLHDRRAFWHGFTRCGTLPREIADNVVTLSSQGITLFVFVYANNDGSRFAVGIGYYLDRLWAHIVCDEHPAKQEALSWVDFAKRVHDHLRSSSSADRSYSYINSATIRDAHLPQTIWDARVFCCSNGESCFDVMIDIEQCSGCCTGPREEVYMFESHPLWLPWTSNSQGSHELRLDGELAKFDLYSGQEIALGDYSDSSGRNFKSCGNIFEDMQKHGIDSTDSVYHPVVSCVSSCKSVSRPRRMRTQNEVAVTSPVEDTFEREGVEHAAKPLVLYQPKGRSLPDTEDFELLLKALSTRLAGKCLVTTVIECSKFNMVDDEETRMDVGGDSALDGGVRSADQGVFIPLCIVASPLAWNKEPPCEERRINFKNIREHFYALANLHHITGTETRHSFSYKRKTNRGVDFPTLFGLEHLKHYVGEITFFQMLSSMVETQLRSEGSAGTTGGNELSAHPSNPLFVGLTVARNLLKSRLRSDAGKNSRNEVEAPLLLKKCEVLQGKLSDETKKTRREVESISQTLSVGLLEHIRTSFLNASEDNHSRQTGQVCSIHYDMLNVRSTVQEIVELQTTLDATQDEDEQRALEEDITGKILWFCWCGVSSEVDQLLPKVLIHVRRKLDSMAPKPTPDYDPGRGFRAIAEIMQKTPRTGQDDDITHLERIMIDAGAGVSRHKLWLGARAAEQARLGRVLKGDPAVDNQETGLSTSPEAPSTSIVHQELDTGTMRL